jgi:membrane protein DedA with SNARE-associated domain
MEELIDNYRYLVLMFGTFLEGEIAILMASLLIFKGIFATPYTIFFAFLGSFVSDWLYYLIGRVNGKVFISGRPKLQARVEPVTSFFHRNKMQILFSYRFMYGFRVVIPIIIGMSGLRPSHFLFYSTVAGLFWASVVTTVGYSVGMLFNVSTDLLTKNLPFIILGFFCFGALSGFVVKRIVSKHSEPAAVHPL